MFQNNEEAKEKFVNKLLREAEITRTTQTVTGGSNTTEKLFDADEAAQIFSDAVVALNEPTGAAGIRSQFSLGTKARDLISNPLEKTSRNVGNVLLEQDINRQQEILKLMQQLEQTRKLKNVYQDTVGGGAIRSGTNYLNELLNN